MNDHLREIQSYVASDDLSVLVVALNTIEPCVKLRDELIIRSISQTVLHPLLEIIRQLIQTFHQIMFAIFFLRKHF